MSKQPRKAKFTDFIPMQDELLKLRITNASLLAALEDIISLTDRDHVAFTRAKAAIAKAKGGVG